MTLARPSLGAAPSALGRRTGGHVVDTTGARPCNFGLGAPRTAGRPLNPTSNLRSAVAGIITVAGHVVVHRRLRHPQRVGAPSAPPVPRGRKKPQHGRQAGRSPRGGAPAGGAAGPRRHSPKIKPKPVPRQPRTAIGSADQREGSEMRRREFIAGPAGKSVHPVERGQAACPCYFLTDADRVVAARADRC
jgi:hypothetical protein